MCSLHPVAETISPQPRRPGRGPCANEPDPTPSARPRIPDTPTRPIASVPRPQRCRSLPSASRLRAQPHGPPARFRPKTTAGGPWPTPTRRSSRWRRRRTRSTRLARQHADLHLNGANPAHVLILSGGQHAPRWPARRGPGCGTGSSGRPAPSSPTPARSADPSPGSAPRPCTGQSSPRSAPRSPTPLRPASGPGETLDRSPIGRAREVLAVLGRVRDIAGGTVHRRHPQPAAEHPGRRIGG